VIDTVAPGVPTVFPLNSTSATPVLRGLFDINDTVMLTVALDGTTYSSMRGEVTLSPGNGVWECPVPLLNALRAGTYSVDVVARDGAGNASSDLTSGEVFIGPRSATFAPTSAKVRPVSDLALRIRVRRIVRRSRRSRSRIHPPRVLARYGDRRRNGTHGALQ